MAPSESLSRKIRWIFILQGVAASVLVMLGTLYGSLLLRDVLLKQRLMTEVQRSWELIEQSPNTPLPRNATFESYFVPAGDMPDHVPPNLRPLTSGLHRSSTDTRRISYVSERADGTLYLSMSPGTTDRIVKWISVLAVAMSVLGIALISCWATGAASGSWRRCRSSPTGCWPGIRAARSRRNSIWVGRVVKTPTRSRISAMRWPACRAASRSTWTANATSPEMPATSCARR